MKHKLLAFAAAGEVGAGLLFMVAPVLPVRLIFGFPESDGILNLGRMTGIALLALGAACWPSQRHENGSAWRGLLVYNALISIYLAYLGKVEHVGGALLWPVSAFHAGLTMLLGFTGSDQRESDV